MTDSAPRRVPLDALHRRLGARMGVFAGWDMPIQYPAGLKSAANRHATPAAADTPAEETAAVEQTEGQEG